MSFDRVSRLRQLLSEAVPAAPAQTHAEADAWRAYGHYAANSPAPALQRSWRERSITDINRVACWYGYTLDVQRHLDLHDVSSVAALDDSALEALHARMVQLENCVQTGCGAPDAPPAT